VSNGIRVYPGTPMAEAALREGRIRSESELLRPTFSFSPGLDVEWLHRTMAEHARKDPRLMTSERSQSPLVPFGLRVLSLLGVRKPFWRFAPVLNRVLAAVS
jgi:hypothetical protein